MFCTLQRERGSFPINYYYQLLLRVLFILKEKTESPMPIINKACVHLSFVAKLHQGHWRLSCPVWLHHRTTARISKEGLVAAYLQSVTTLSLMNMVWNEQRLHCSKICNACPSTTFEASRLYQLSLTLHSLSLVPRILITSTFSPQV